MLKKLSFFMLLAIAFYGCAGSNHVSNKEIIELKNQVNYLNAKVDSLEAQLAYKVDIEKLLEHDSLLFSLKRTPCLGNCPVFEFKVYKDGWASYQGKNFVDMLGVYTANLTAEQLREVKSLVRNAHFYAFRDLYDDDRLDIPAMIIEYHGPQGVKKVTARTEIPYTFRTLTVDLEELADQIKWYPAE